MRAAEHVGTDPRVVAVVVTYNRRALLGEALAALDAQDRKPDAVIVVDNASTDGTADAVRAEAPHARLIALAENTGGAGGFAIGIEAALSDGADLVWVMDDDTVPEPGALAELLDARQRYDGPPPALLASRVVWTDGRDHPMNTPRRKPLVNRAERAAADRAGCLPIRSASFVSALFDADVCRTRGLPVADYFLWNDDFEFTTRILRSNIGLYCPASRVVHKTAKFGAVTASPGERFFYEVRNKIWMLTRSRSLGPVDRLLYTGATLRRWVQMIVRGPDRGILARGQGRGIAAGLRHGPRPNDDVLGAARPAVPHKSELDARGHHD